MLSYRHAFHAGNHADVLKHIVLIELLHYLNQKDKPYAYIDTHAGAGLYLLHEGFAAQNAEYNTGVTRLWNATWDTQEGKGGTRGAPELIARYLDVVRSFQETAPSSSTLRYYPGSPLLAQRLLRAGDTLRLYEKHPTDFSFLERNIHKFRTNAKARCDKSDGFAGLKAVLPPLSRRGLVLIDPPYEMNDDYRLTVAALADALKRFATGVFMVWYPCLARAEVTRMIQQFTRLPFSRSLHVSLTVKRRPISGIGMFGSGLWIGNPPWTLKARLEETLPYLMALLGEDDTARYVLEETSAQ